MRTVFKKLGSLRLTVALLVASMFLVFFGTLDQVSLGIQEVQKRYFESFFVIYPSTPDKIGWLPMPGGYLIGGLLIVNLVTAFILRFKARWSKGGIHLIHGGVLLLLISGFTTSALQRESQLSVIVGERASYSRDMLTNELVFIDTTHAEHNTEISIPAKLLETDASFSHEALPFTIHIQTFHKNANIYLNPEEAFFEQAPMAYRASATHGIAAEQSLVVLPLRMDHTPDAVNTATAMVEVKNSQGTLGTWLVSNVFDSNQHAPQTFEYAGKNWEIAMRFKRYHKPYWIEALEVSHDVYPGTEIPKNFSSRVNIIPMDGSEPHETLIYMNHPLRYDGLTFFQHQMSAPRNQTTLLVVQNASWQLPYIAITLVGLGMIWQFSWSLWRGLKR